MKKDVFQMIEVLTSKATEAKEKGENKGDGQVEDQITMQTVNSLSENIKSKEQADSFKKMLASLER